MFAPVVVLLLSLVLAGWYLSVPPQRYAPLVEVRDLLADPDRYDGHLVRVRTAGFAAGADGSLGYVVVYGTPAALVATWEADPPRARPPVLSGVFRAGRPARLTDCRPAP